MQLAYIIMREKIVKSVSQKILQLAYIIMREKCIAENIICSLHILLCVKSVSQKISHAACIYYYA